MLNLEKEVFHHAPGKINPAGPDQSEDNEVAIPTIHFVETAARNNIFVLEIQQPRSNLRGIDLPRRSNDSGQRFDMNLASVLQFLHHWGRSKIGRKIQHRGFNQFWIYHRLTVGHRAGQGVPS